jgi:hypothetical protein
MAELFPDSFPLVAIDPVANGQNEWVALCLRVEDGRASTQQLQAVFGTPDLLAAIAIACRPIGWSGGTTSMLSRARVDMDKTIRWVSSRGNDPVLSVPRATRTLRGCVSQSGREYSARSTRPTAAGNRSTRSASSMSMSRDWGHHPPSRAARRGGSDNCRRSGRRSELLPGSSATGDGWDVMATSPLYRR